MTEIRQFISDVQEYQIKSLVNRRVFRSQSGQKCVVARGSALDPAGELIVLLRPLAGLRKGLKGEEMGTGKGGKDERRGEEDKSRGQEVSRGTMLTHSPKQNLNAP